MINKLVAMVVSIILLSGCSLFEVPEKKITTNASESLTASAQMNDVKGSSLGSIELKESEKGVLISLHLENVPAGERAIHIHEAGKCEPPAFDTAGAHFNPTNKEHGHNNPKGYHLGDLPNITADADGKVELEFLAEGLTLQKDALNSLIDQNGSAFIIHEKADDYVTDPSGNSGKRIACGIVVANNN